MDGALHEVRMTGSPPKLDFPLSTKPVVTTNGACNTAATLHEREHNQRNCTIEECGCVMYDYVYILVKRND